jgi:chemotaxis response regulator CheB
MCSSSRNGVTCTCSIESSARSRYQSLGLVITVFLRSLTKHWDGKLIAVIVSGYDSDGAAALCCIKDVGGASAD